MEILGELKRRHSVLVFQDKDVEKEKVDAMIEAARWAPSCFNNQPWNYVLVSRKDSTREALDNSLPAGNSWAHSAPYIAVVCARVRDSCETNRQNYYMYDVGLSVMSFCIEAEHQGIGTHQMAGFDEQSVRQALSMPDEYRVVVIIAFGYKQDPTEVWDTLHPKIKKRLNNQRERKSSDDNFFFEKFSKKHK
ncbi:nitroreductase family protein [Candidatus Woesearchaeota archaeon]|nr:nitroreductase family protein [Candidatus Woesearchaeota archaeon]